MKQIPLTQGYVALVNNADYPQLAQFKWCALIAPRTVYAVRNIRIKSKRRTLFMHRAILGVTNPKVLTDHRDHNGLNNRRRNIRICTPAQNQHNRKSQSNSSGIKGVSWNNKRRCWIAQIKAHKHIWLGEFASKTAAARAYARAARKHFGKFAA